MERGDPSSFGIPSAEHEREVGGTEGKQIIEGFGIVSLGVDRRNCV
jgi:hypothetical protein